MSWNRDIIYPRITTAIGSAMVTLLMFVVVPNPGFVSHAIIYSLRTFWGLNTVRVIWLLIWRPFSPTRGVMTYLRFLFLCTKYYRSTVSRQPGGGFWYGDVSVHGVPQLTLLIAHGREAWRVSDFVTNYLGRT